MHFRERPWYGLLSTMSGNSTLPRAASIELDVRPAARTRIFRLHFDASSAQHLRRH